jgi:hypothetical protein
MLECCDSSQLSFAVGVATKTNVDPAGPANGNPKR